MTGAWPGLWQMQGLMAAKGLAQRDSDSGWRLRDRVVQATMKGVKGIGRAISMYPRP